MELKSKLWYFENFNLLRALKKNSVATILLVFVSCLAVSGIQNPSGILDGKIFKLAMYNKNSGNKPMDEELKFKNGMLSLRELSEAELFGTAPYTTRKDTLEEESDIIIFECTQYNERNETLYWYGKINNQSVSGYAIWSKDGRTKKQFDFTGSLKLKKK